jgi:hypothetical protein
MSTKELIQAELDTLSDADLDALYALIKQFIQSKRPAKPRSLMATLRGIQIDAPPDFAANLDLYVSSNNSPPPLIVTLTPTGCMRPWSKYGGIFQVYIKFLH